MTKYIRIVLAVDDDDGEKGVNEAFHADATPDGLTFRERLDVFIESDTSIIGAYTSGDYTERESALYGGWVSQPPVADDQIGTGFPRHGMHD